MKAESFDPVCEFYTNHPYPPLVENLEREEIPLWNLWMVLS